MYTNLSTPVEIADQIAKRAREKRLSLNLSQFQLSQRSGVSLGTLKKFEGSGKISLESLLKLSLVLDCLEDFSKLFGPKPLEKIKSLDELINQKVRKRGRK